MKIFVKALNKQSRIFRLLKENISRTNDTKLLEYFIGSQIRKIILDVQSKELLGERESNKGGIQYSVQ